MIEGGLSEMGTADRGALREVELEAAGAQRVGHAHGAGGPIGTELGQRLEQARGAVVEQVAEEVEVLPVVVERGELDRRRPRGGREPRPPASASSTPSTVSWSVSASSSTPASAAAATTSAGG